MPSPKASKPEPLIVPTPALSWDGGALRPWSEGDVPALVAAWQEPTVAEFNEVPPAPTLETAERWIATQDVRLERRLSVDLVIEPGSEPQVAGEVGLSGFRDAVRGALIGYWLMPDARGAGLATNAVRALTEWAHVALELDVIVARCHPANTASQAVASRSGMAHEADDSYGHQLWISRTREQ